MKHREFLFYRFLAENSTHFYFYRFFYLTKNTKKDIFYDGLGTSYS